MRRYKLDSAGRPRDAATGKMVSRDDVPTRTLAALKGWATRRANAEERARNIAERDEPEEYDARSLSDFAGDFSDDDDDDYERGYSGDGPDEDGDGPDEDGFGGYTDDDFAEYEMAFDYGEATT